MFVKLTEGGFNRAFLITMHGGFEMVARIPYPVTVPKFYAIASEVATMRFPRSSGLPFPEVYDYSLQRCEDGVYIFMEFMRGTKLSDVWMEPEGTGYRFGLASTCSARISNDVDSFSGWWKPLLYQRPGEAGRQGGHPAQRRGLLRRSRCEAGYVVRKEVAARCGQGTMYATLCLLFC